MVTAEVEMWSADAAACILRVVNDRKAKLSTSHRKVVYLQSRCICKHCFQYDRPHLTQIA
jgi:hypothetical protein